MVSYLQCVEFGEEGFLPCLSASKPIFHREVFQLHRESVRVLDYESNGNRFAHIDSPRHVYQYFGIAPAYERVAKESIVNLRVTIRLQRNQKQQADNRKRKCKGQPIVRHTSKTPSHQEDRKDISIRDS